MAAIDTGRCVNTGTAVRRSCARNAIAGTSAASAMTGSRAAASRNSTVVPSSTGPTTFSGWGSCFGSRAGCDCSARRAAQATITIRGRFTQNTQRQPTEPVSAAPSAGPIRAETPHMAAFRPNARGRSSFGTYSANSPSGTANMNPAPSPRTPRDRATTGIDGASPPSTFAAENSTQAIAKLRATP